MRLCGTGGGRRTTVTATQSDSAEGLGLLKALGRWDGQWPDGAAQPRERRLK